MTSYTVTATNTDGSHGIAVQVEVLTGAAETGGASGSVDNGIANGTGSGTTFTFSLSPAFTGSFIAWAATDANGADPAPVAAANNKLLTVAANSDNFQDTVNGSNYGAGYYSGTVTAGTGVTVGCSNTGASGAAPELAAYEIQPSPSWAEDASTPAYVKVTGTNAATTASFTPPGGAVLVAAVSCNFASSNTGNKITVASTPSLTWTLRASNSTQSNNGGTAIYTATVPAATAAPTPLPAAPGPTWQRQFKHRQSLAAPQAAATAPGFPPGEITQRRQAWPRVLLRRGKVTTPVPAQLNPPWPASEVRQGRQPRGFWPVRGRRAETVPAQGSPVAVNVRRQAPPRALTRRGKVTTPVPAQLNPPWPATEVRPWRQPRGLWPVRGHRFETVPAQQAATGPPAWVQSHRSPGRAIALLIRRGRVGVPVPAQVNPPWPPAEVTQRRQAHPRALTRRGKVISTVPAQVNPPWPPVEAAQRRQAWPRVLQRRGRQAWPVPAQDQPVPHRGPARAIALIRRRFRQLLPWPQAAKPAFSVGVLSAGDAATAVLSGGGQAAGILGAGDAATAVLGAGDQRTGGPS